MRCTLSLVLSIGLLAGCGSGEPGAWEPVEVFGGLLMIDVFVEGASTHCIVDTGATVSLLHSSVLDGDALQDVSFQFADVSQVGAAVPSADEILEGLDESSGFSQPIDCVLGWDTLSAFSFTVDYATARMRFSDRPIPVAGLPEPIAVPLQETSPLAIAVASFQDVELPAVLDTGASTAVLGTAVVAALEEPPETEPISIATVDGIMFGEVGVLSTAALGDAAHSDVDFISFDSPQLDALAALLGEPIEAIVGASTFLRYATTFNAPDGELLLQEYDPGVVEQGIQDYRDDWGL